jgi:5-methylcytosine-specific restriction enzyme A
VTVKRVCPSCGRIGCEEHKRKPWQETTPRRNRTVSGWQQGRRRRYVLRRDNLTCHRCGRVYVAGDLICDHVVPLAEGGADDVSNLAPLCRDCNRIKTAEEAKRGRERSKRPGGHPHAHRMDGTGQAARGEVPPEAA